MFTLSIALTVKLLDICVPIKLEITAVTPPPCLFTLSIALTVNLLNVCVPINLEITVVTLPPMFVVYTCQSWTAR